MNADEFAEFWQHYPRRIGKFAAEKAYRKARTLTSHEALMDGIARYIASKPGWQAYAHPASWLNAGRWMDEVAPPVTYASWDCPHTPRCPHRAACAVVAMRTA